MDGGGGGGDAFGSSTAPLTWHDFLERMRQPSAADFVKSIKSFIVSFSNRAPDPEKDSAAVQEFLISMEGAFRAHALWVGSSEEELDSAGEGLEKYVMTKLYNRAFASLPDDVKHDDELFEKIALIQQFVRPEYLDIKPVFQNETSWLLAQKELQKINMYKAPRDKLVCILNCCKVINNLLLNAFMASNGNPPGADEFLPVLIYVVIKANPPQLYSNLLYIQRYRRQSRLVSEAAYFFTNLLSAESFIWNIDAHSLSMDESDFQRNMESARDHLLGLSSNTGGQEKQINQAATEEKVDKSKDKYAKENPAPSREYDQAKNVDSRDREVSDRPSISDLERKGATDLLNEDQLSKYFQEYPFLYARGGDLTVSDVENLLNSYKQLVFKYVSLSKGMGISSTTLPVVITEAQVKTETAEELNGVTEMDNNNGKYEGSTNKDVAFPEGMGVADTLLPAVITEAHVKTETGEGMGVADTLLPAVITEAHVKTETGEESKNITETETSNEKYGGLRRTETSSSDNLFSSSGDDKDLGLRRDDSITDISAEKGEVLE